MSCEASFFDDVYDRHTNDNKNYCVVRDIFTKNTVLANASQYNRINDGSFWKNLEKIETIDNKVFFTYLLREREYKTFENFDDAKEYADYTSRKFFKFADGYHSRENHHSNIPKIISNVIIYVIHKNNKEYHTKYWVTDYKPIDTKEKL